MTELAGERPQAVSVRLDKWLWAARFYKTRALAIQAIDSGKIAVNGECAKPARSLKPDDAVTVRKGPYRFDIVVRALSAASEAHKLYRRQARASPCARRLPRSCPTSRSPHPKGVRLRKRAG